jgi:hypothetical protein
VIICGATIERVCACVQTLCSLLSPLDWVHTLIPLVPRSALTLCHAPTPFCMGLLRCSVLYCHYTVAIMYRSDLGCIRELLTANHNDDDVNLLIVDIDYGIVRQPTANKRNTILPNKLRLALDTAITQLLAAEKVDEAMSDDRLSTLFLVSMACLLGHYSQHINSGSLNEQTFISSHPSKSTRQALSALMSTDSGQLWLHKVICVTSCHLFPFHFLQTPKRPSEGSANDDRFDMICALMKRQKRLPTQMNANNLCKYMLSLVNTIISK